MTQKRIIGAVGVGDKTFTAGQEAAFEAAATAAHVDFARLEAKGVIRGFTSTADAGDGDATDAPATKAGATKASRRKR